MPRYPRAVDDVPDLRPASRAWRALVRWSKAIVTVGGALAVLGGYATGLGAWLLKQMAIVRTADLAPLFQGQHDTRKTLGQIQDDVRSIKAALAAEAESKQPAPRPTSRRRRPETQEHGE